VLGKKKQPNLTQMQSPT